MREVAIVGAGMIPFGKDPERLPEDLGADAVRLALADAGISEGIQAFYCGSVLQGMMMGQRVLRETGMTGIPIFNVEDACSSSAAALNLAWLAVASGQHDLVLVAGVEKLSRFGGGVLPLVEEDLEVRQGVTMPAVYAMRAQRYMELYGLTPADLALVAVKNHNNGALNPRAALRKRFTLEEVMNARMICEPFTLPHCCPNVDGAAALVVSAGEHAHRYRGKPVRVLSSVVTSGLFKNTPRDLLAADVTTRAVSQAYAAAGLGPEDIDVCEVHDAFTIAELLYYEALGFCARGDAIGMLKDGRTEIAGDKPFNPSGGLLSRGHPIGATGAAQVAEIVWQLRGEAGAHQVHHRPRVGLTQCTGGGVWGFDHGACAVHILGV